MAVYPNIRPEAVMTMNIVVMNIEQDPSYLDRAECPYPKEVKDFFRKKIEVIKGKRPKVSGSGSNEGEGEGDDGGNGGLFEGKDELIVLDTQIIQLIEDLEDFSQKLDVGDVSEKMAYFRTKTALIEKLVTMRERISNLKEINDFRLTLLSFMNEICTKDQITELMHRLDGILGTKKDDL